MPKVSEQYLIDRREQILDAARECFLRDGFHATSMQDLFAQAGLSSGAVYRYFASKDEMIIAIAEDNLREVIAMIHAIVVDPPGPRGSPGSPGESIGSALANAVELVADRHRSTRLGGLALQVWSEAARNPALAEQFNALLSQARSELAEVVRRYQSSGSLPATVPADAIATVLIAVIPGYLVQLALLGPKAVEGTADAIRALWP